MKCPICVSVGQTSKFYCDRGGITTMMGALPYHDEDGKYHYHDPNDSTTRYRCSRGHEFRVTVRHKCWCGYGKPSTVMVEGDDGKWAEASPEQAEAVLGTNHEARGDSDA